MLYFGLLVFVCVTYVRAQIPSFGGCPDYEPMANFNRTRFLGKWYEAERYFTVSEVGTKCVMVEYELRPDGKLWVNNAYTSRITSVQRIVSGVIQNSLKGPESVLNVKYQSFPVNYDTNLQILDTDYENYAVIYSCSRIGPIGHTESAWVFTRDRVAPGPVMQRAYGILDKYRISRTFFVKSEQTECETVAPAEEAELAKEKGIDEPIKKVVSDPIEPAEEIPVEPVKEKIVEPVETKEKVIKKE